MMGSVVVAAAIGTLVGFIGGALLLLMLLPVLPVRLKVTQVHLSSAVVESWLDNNGLVACPKGPDFKPARMPRSSA